MITHCCCNGWGFVKFCFHGSQLFSFKCVCVCVCYILPGQCAEHVQQTSVICKTVMQELFKGLWGLRQKAPVGPHPIQTKVGVGEQRFNEKRNAIWNQWEELGLKHRMFVASLCSNSFFFFVLTNRFDLELSKFERWKTFQNLKVKWKSVLSKRNTLFCLSLNIFVRANKFFSVAQNQELNDPCGRLDSLQMTEIKKHNIIKAICSLSKPPSFWVVHETLFCFLLQEPSGPFSTLLMIHLFTSL